MVEILANGKVLNEQHAMVGYGPTRVKVKLERWARRSRRRMGSHCRLTVVEHRDPLRHGMEAAAGHLPLRRR